jgi:hypothetical protein
MDLSGHLEYLQGRVGQACSLSSAADAPRWKGSAAGRFRERRDLLLAHLQRASQLLITARGVTAEFERVWWEERAQAASAGGAG